MGGYGFAAFGNGFAQGLNTGADLYMKYEKAKSIKDKRRSDKAFMDSLKAAGEFDGGVSAAAMPLDMGPSDASDLDAGLGVSGPLGADGGIGLPEGAPGLGGQIRGGMLSGDTAGAEAPAGADFMAGFDAQVDGGLLAFDREDARRRGVADASLAKFVERGEDGYPQLLNESMMDRPFGQREDLTHRLALGYVNKSNGSRFDRIIVNKGTGGLTAWVSVPEVDANGNPVVGEDGRPRLTSVPQVVSHKDFMAACGRAGVKLDYDTFSGTYMTPDRFALSQTAWVRDRGTAYFEGMSADDARRDYAEWRKERRAEMLYDAADARQRGKEAKAEYDKAKKEAETLESKNRFKEYLMSTGMDAKEAESYADGWMRYDPGAKAAEKRKQEEHDAEIALTKARTEAYRSRGGTGGAGNFTGEGEGGGYDMKMAEHLWKRADNSEAALRAYLEANPGSASGSADIFAAQSQDPRFIMLQNAALRDRYNAIQYGYEKPAGGAEGGEAASGAGMTSGDIDAATKAGKPLDEPAAKQQPAGATPTPVATAQSEGTASAEEPDEYESLRSELFSDGYWEKVKKEDRKYKDAITANATAVHDDPRVGKRRVNYRKAQAERQKEYDDYLYTTERWNAGTNHTYEESVEEAEGRLAAAEAALANEKRSKYRTEESVAAAEARQKEAAKEYRKARNAHLQFLREIKKDPERHVRNARAKRANASGGRR